MFNRFWLQASPSLPTQPGLSVVPIVPAPDGRLHILDSLCHMAGDAEDRASRSKATTSSAACGMSPGPADRRRPPTSMAARVYARQQVTTKAALAARGEYLRDDGGLFSGVTQSLKETTLTYEYKVVGRVSDAR